MEKKCISCGMPLRNKEDYPLDDESKEFCRYCANEDGSMKSFDDAVEGMSAFLQDMQNLSTEDAKDAAINTLKKNPAWKDKK